MNTVSAIVHGESGMGKTWLGATGPTPRLVLDVEGRSKYAPYGRRVMWDPRTPPPDMAEIDTAVVKLRRFDEMDFVYQWLNSGQHPFRSFIVDSLTELQKRAIDMIAGTNAMRTQDWGDLLRRMEFLVRAMRDLADHPTNPIPLVLFVCFTQEKGGHRRPLIQGSLGNTLPFYVDVNGYLTVVDDPSDPTQAARALFIQPVQVGLVVKDGTDLLTQHYGPVIYRPNFAEMLGVLNAAA